MNTTNNINNTAAPSITIAPRNPAKGVLLYVVTITTHKDVRSYPCRSFDSALKLAERFIAGVVKFSAPRQAEEDATVAQQTAVFNSVAAAAVTVGQTKVTAPVLEPAPVAQAA